MLEKRVSKRFLLVGVLACFSCILPALLSAQLHWLDELEENYLTGNWNNIELLLDESRPINTIERAGHSFYRAKITLEQDEIIRLLENTIRLSPDSMYGQRALVKLANISLLERNYQDSYDHLKRLNPQIISDRDYLLASVYLKLDKYPEAIRAAQDFIKITKDHVKRELSYLQIIEAYLLNEQFHQALLTLETMKEQDYIVNLASLVDYKEAYCLEKTGQHSEAIEKYKYVITQYPYTEDAFQAERRLYDMLIYNSEKVSYSDLIPIRPHIERQDRTYMPEIKEDRVGTQEEHYVQVNAFADLNNAISHSEYLRNLGYENIVFSKIVFEQKVHVVAVGPFQNLEAAKSVQRDIKDNLNLDSFLIRY